MAVNINSGQSIVTFPTVKAPTVLGRISSGTGVVQSLTRNELLNFLNISGAIGGFPTGAYVIDLSGESPGDIEVDFSELPDEYSCLILLLPDGQSVLTPTGWPPSTRGIWSLRIGFLDNGFDGINSVALGSEEDVFMYGFPPTTKPVFLDYNIFSGTVAGDHMPGVDLTWTHTGAPFFTDDISSEQLTNSGLLRKWHSDLAVSTESLVTIMSISDSLGIYSASDPEYTAWPAIFEKALLEKLGYARSSGYVSIREVGSSPYGDGLAWDTVSGTAANTGPGGWGRSLAIGQSCVIDRFGDGVVIHYTKQKTSGTLTININGTNVGTINTANAALGVGVKSSGFTASYANPDGFSDMTITVTASSAAAILDGCYITNGNRSSGVQLIRAQHGGWGFTDFLNNANKSTLEVVEALQPSCIITNLGLNEYIIHNNEDADSVAGLLADWVDALRTKSPDSSLVYIFEINPVDYTPDGWTTVFKKKLKKTCYEKNVYFLEWDDLLGPYSSSSDPLDLVSGLYGPDGWTGDGLHPEDNGHWMMAQPVIDALVPKSLSNNVSIIEDFTTDGNLRINGGELKVLGSSLAVGEIKSFIESGTRAIQIRSNASHAQPVLALGVSDNPFILPGLYLGSGGSSAADTYLTRSGSAAMKLTGALDVTGNLTVNTNKFSVTASTGNTVLGALTASSTSVSSSTASHGKAESSADSSSVGVKIFSNSSHTNPVVSIGNVVGVGAGLYLGAGGSSAADVYLLRSGAGALSITGATSVGNGTASHGQVKLYSDSGLGTGASYVSVFKDTADTTAVATLGNFGSSQAGLYLGAGGSSSPDTSLARASSGLTTMTAPSGFHIAAPLSLSKTTTNVSSTSTQIPCTATYAKLTSSADRAMTTSSALISGTPTEGQMLMIEMTSAFTITITGGGSSGLKLASVGAAALTRYSTLSLIYDGSFWVEVARSIV